MFSFFSHLSKAELILRRLDLNNIEKSFLVECSNTADSVLELLTCLYKVEN